MTMKILEDCIACGACLPECPTESISEGDGILYVINQETCVIMLGPSAPPHQVKPTFLALLCPQLGQGAY